MIDFPCPICRAPLQAEEAQVGHRVRCPTCESNLRVPPASRRRLAGVGAGGVSGDSAPISPPPRPANESLRPPPVTPGRSVGRRYGFNCAYCSSRLEAVEPMAAQEGQCPTCGNTITVPILDRYGRLIDPKTRQVIRQDPHPVHAYAAAGDRAPRIKRIDEKRRVIVCPKCAAVSPITSNNCKACGMPFTMEGTTLDAGGATNGFCIVSLVLGIIGLAAFVAVLPPVLAIVLGIIGYNQVVKSGESSGKGMAGIGITLGVIGCVFEFAHLM